MSNKLGIAILTYRTGAVLAELLASLASDPKFPKYRDKIYIYDDSGEPDETAAITEMCREYISLENIHVNDKNLGLDRNFEQAMRDTPYEYVWVIGHDDLIVAGAFAQVEGAITSFEPDILQLNFSVYDRPTGKIVRERWFKKQTHIRSILDLKEYIEVVGSAGSFISSVVRRRAAFGAERPYPRNWLDFCSILDSRFRYCVLDDPLVRNAGNSEGNEWNLGIGRVNAQLDLYDWVADSGMDATSAEALKKSFRRYMFRKLISHRIKCGGKVQIESLDRLEFNVELRKLIRLCNSFPISVMRLFWFVYRHPLAKKMYWLLYRGN
jgi:hypothetical protein